MPTTPAIQYTNRDFDSLRKDLINFVKTRFPDKFGYFNEASADMIYLELLAYMGDSLNFSIDRAFNESFKLTAQSKDSLLRLADDKGFYEWYAKPAITQLTVSIDVPGVANSDGSAVVPNSDYLISIKDGMTFSSSNGAIFECLDEVNFANDYLRTIVPNLDSNNQVINFTVNKQIMVVAGQTKYQRYYIDETSVKPFLEIIINDTLVTEVMSVVMVPGNIYDLPSESQFRDYNNAFLPVENLTEDKIFVALNPDDNNDVELQQLVNAYTDMSINYGTWINKPRRFIIRRDKYGRTRIIFGSNIINTNTWEQLVGSVDLSTLGTFTINQILNGSALGEVPVIDNTLFIKYRAGAGTNTNAAVGEITGINSKTFNAASQTIDYAVLTTVRNSLRVSANVPAVGGTDDMSNEEIRNSIGKIFAANDRIVTYEDIVSLIYKMPPEYGRPFRVSYEEIKPKVINYSQIKGYVETQLDDLLAISLSVEREQKIAEIKNYLDALSAQPVETINNQLTSYGDSTNNIVNNIQSLWIGEKCRLYILGIDQDQLPTGLYKNENGAFISANKFLKDNIKRWLINRRVIGDWIDIVDANIVNFQIEFTIQADNKNKQKVLIDCLNAMKDYFNIYNWNINQPIFIGNVQTILQEIEGVINVVDIKFYNIFGTDMTSGKQYSDPETGTYFNNSSVSTNTMNNRFLMNPQNNIINSRPSDFFSIRYPDDDIIGKVL